MAKETNILDILNSSPSVSMLRARSCHIIIEFLTGVFDNSAPISQEMINSLLADYLDSCGIENDDESGVLVTDTYEEKAEKYIKKWTDSGFLTNYMDDDGEIYYDLSSHTSKVIDWLSNLRQEEYIGTESKFKSIITQLRELVEFTNEDKEKRLQLLKDKRMEIDQQIQDLEAGNEIKVYEEYEIIPRFKQISKLAKELLSDFKDVDNNFKTITREIYQRQIDPSLKKGEILQYTFDALDELKSSSQGKSFYAFWEFLLTREMQSELDTLITDLFQTLEERNIGNDDTFLKNMVTYLYESGRKVYQTNDKMAEKLSRIIRESDSSRSDMTKHIIQDIKNKLIEVSKTDKKPDISLVIDDGIDISIPFERRITFEKNEEIEYRPIPEMDDLSIVDFEELGKVFNSKSVDRKQLEQNINETMKGKSQVTLNEVISQHPLQQGLTEFFAYLGILNGMLRKTIDKGKQHLIEYDAESKKFIQIPEIIISK